MKKTHYTDGYGGSLNYKTYCGIEIHSHSETDTATINPKKVDCKKCMNKPEWKQDFEDSYISNNGIKRRIYLESDVMHASEVRNAQREVSDLCIEKSEPFVRRVFNEIIDYAWHDLAKTWEAVKNSDEIYSDSSLLPLSGNSYVGAPVIFNGMCERAIKENVTGKEVYILRPLKDIYWDMIDLDLMTKAFKSNKLFMQDENFNLIEVDVIKVAKKNKARK